MYLFELGTRPWEVKESTPEETAIKRVRIERYEAICYAVVARQRQDDAQRTLKK
jgi:hypothetical protein